MEHNWIEITAVGDRRKRFLCTLTGQQRWEEYYVDVDNQREDADEEVLRQLGHGLREGV